MVRSEIMVLFVFHLSCEVHIRSYRVNVVSLSHHIGCIATILRLKTLIKIQSAIFQIRNRINVVTIYVVQWFKA
jgi:hypothetical protein